MQPVFYAALAFAAGITGVAARLSSPRATWVIGSLILCGFALCLRSKARTWGALLLCAACGYGWAYRAVAYPRPPDTLVETVTRMAPDPRDRITVRGYLRDDAEVSPAYTRLDLEAEAVETEQLVGALGVAGPRRIWPVHGGIRLYAYPERKSAAASSQPGWPLTLASLRAGQAIQVTARLHPITRYRDPGVADFSRAARREGVDYSGTLKADAIELLGGIRSSYSMRERAHMWSFLSQRVDALVPPERDARVNALLRGMLLGDAARLDETTRTALQIDGVYHIVVVAGLHIAVLAGFFLLLFRRVRLRRLSSEAATVLLVALYAWVIVGRTPTLRATLMMAVYFVARCWYRERQALNAVGIAAIVLLLWRPLDLFDPGFQMSFASAALLAGIVSPLLARMQPYIAATGQLKDAGYDETFPPHITQWRIELRMVAAALSRGSSALSWRLLPALLRVGMHLAEVLLVSLVLQVGLSPLMIAYFHRANPWAGLVNAVVVPAVSLLIPLAWLAVLGSSLVTPLTSGLGWLLRTPAHAMVAFATNAAGWPLAGTRVPTAPAWAVWCFVAAVAGWFWSVAALPKLSRRSKLLPQATTTSDESALQRFGRKCAWWRVAVGTAFVATLSFVLSVSPFPPRIAGGVLSATFLDVGQGDSAFISFPNGRTMLIDAGPRTPSGFDVGEEVVSNYLWSLGLHRIDAALLSHPHSDHMGGMTAVLRNFRPRELWTTSFLPPDLAVTHLFETAVQEGTVIERRSAGQRFQIGDVEADVLLPEADRRRAAGGDANDDSLVLRLSYAGGGILFTGDIERDAEQQLLMTGLDSAATVLKVPHHGSRTSSTPELLEAVQPRAAIISVGRSNPYGHPSGAVLDRLQVDGVRTFRTDTDGAIECVLDGQRLRVFKFRAIDEAVSGATD